MQRPRPIWLCADDYGIAPGVSKGIRELIALGRLNATSVMTAAPAFDRTEAEGLAALNGSRRVAVGLHVTLTAPFRPLSQGFMPLRDGHFPNVRELLQASLLRRLHVPLMKAEVTAQLRAFAAAFGRPPDFVDGHQHVHLFPQIRNAVLGAMREFAPNAWVRQCGRPLARTGIGDRKALLLDILSVRFRRRARRMGVAFNPAFAGTYDFVPGANFSQIFPSFLRNMPAGGVVMCHPGFVDETLMRLDPLTTLREREYAFLASDEFPEVLDESGVTLTLPD